MSSISADAAASTTVTAYWVHLSQKWALNHAAKCIHLQLVEPIRVIHLVTEQRTGECNVINIHPCNRLVHIEKNIKLQMSLCIPLKDKTEIIRDKTLLSASVAGFERNWWSDWHEHHLELFYCSVDNRRQLHNRRCIWHKIGGGAQKPESLGAWKVGGGSSLAAL